MKRRLTACEEQQEETVNTSSEPPFDAVRRIGSDEG